MAALTCFAHPAMMDALEVRKMRDIRLIATDMDGTLLGRELDSIPPENARALREAADAGIALALVTGRMPDDAGFFALDAGLKAHVLGLNGCTAQHEPLGWVTRNRFMDGQAARKARDAMETWGLPFALFSMHELALSGPLEDFPGGLMSFGTFFHRQGGRTRFCADAQSLDRLMVRVSKFVVDGRANPDGLRALKRQLEEAVSEVEVVSSWAGFLEIMPRGVNKGAALTALAEKLGIPMERVMVLGDNDNDVSMLEIAGCAVAMENATPAARQAAHWIAPSNLKNGVSAAVRGLALGDGSCLRMLNRCGAGRRGNC